MDTTKILKFLDEAEAILAEVASKLAPWFAPLLSAVVVGMAVLEPPFNWPIWLAWLTGGAIELSGIATLNTALLLWSYRADQPADRKPPLLPLILAMLCAAGYLVTALALTVVLKVWPGFQLVAYGLFAILALVSGVNLTLRRDHMRRTGPLPAMVRKSPAKGPARKPPAEQTDAERRANLDRANAARKPTMVDFQQAKALRDSGLTWPQVAKQLEISTTTAKRWYRLAEQHEPAHLGLNGKGVSDVFSDPIAD